MVSAKLINHLRETEAEKRIWDKRSFENRPFSDPAFKHIQAKQLQGQGDHILADVVPRGPTPKVQSIAQNALDASQTPYQIQPAIHPALERLERKLLGSKAVPRIFLRDMTVYNEIALPYESVLFEAPLPDESDLHFIKDNAIRGKGIDQKLMSTTFLDDYQLVPVLYGIAEPVFGNRLLPARDSRRY
jgi:hypothetical protein